MDGRPVFLEDFLLYNKDWHAPSFAYRGAHRITWGNPLLNSVRDRRNSKKQLDMICSPSKELKLSHNSVLEIGTGSGYQTAILAKLCASVHSLERVSAFIPKARERLRALKLSNFSLHLADGYKGLEESGPFDTIICTAAPKSIPLELMNQLKVGGRMIIPVGDSVQQQLKVIERKEEEFQSNVVDDVMFVPLQEGIVS